MNQILTIAEIVFELFRLDNQVADI
jgi:hypothetical protein